MDSNERAILCLGKCNYEDFELEYHCIVNCNEQRKSYCKHEIIINLIVTFKRMYL